MPVIIRNIRGIEESQEIKVKSLERPIPILTEDDKIFLVALKSYYKGDKLLLEEYLGKQLD